MDPRIYQIGAPIVAAALLAIGFIQYRAGAPSEVVEQLDAKVSEHQSRRWDRPVLVGEPTEGNAFAEIRSAIDATSGDLEGQPFSGSGSIGEGLRTGEFPDGWMQTVETSFIQHRIAGIEDAVRRSYSWAGGDLESYAVLNRGRGAPGDDPTSAREILRTVRMMTADAVRQGGGDCLVQLAQTARFLQDATVGAPPVVALTRAAGMGHLRYGVPLCGSESSPEALERAREVFERLVTHPVPMSASLRASVMTSGLTLRSRVASARPIPTSALQVKTLFTAPTLWPNIGRALGAMDILKKVDPADYPTSIEHFESFVDEMEAGGQNARVGLGLYAMRTSLEKDEVSQNALRASLLAVAHYQRISTGDLRTTPPALVEASFMRDAVTGDELTWRITSKGGAEICFEADMRDDAPLCWQLPPWRGR